MRLAYERCSGPRGFRADQFRESAEEIPGTNLKDWFRKAIASTEELDYSEALGWFGLRLRQGDGKGAPSWKLEVSPNATTDEKRHLDEWLGGAVR